VKIDPAQDIVADIDLREDDSPSEDNSSSTSSD
jgi:hypothetical protein